MSCVITCHHLQTEHLLSADQPDKRVTHLEVRQPVLEIMGLMTTDGSGFWILKHGRTEFIYTAVNPPNMDMT